MKTVLCFGNPYIKGDSISVQLAQELNVPNHEFVVVKNPEDLINYKNFDEILLMDVVKGIDRVMMIEELDKVKFNNSLTLHDMDVGFMLRLMKATGRLKSVNIIGLPLGLDKETIKRQVEELLSK